MQKSTTHRPISATQGTSTAWPADKLAAFLEKAFPGTRVSVRDDTALHAGHNADVGHFGGHYRVRMVWDGFEGQGRLQRHKAVMHALEAVWKEKHIHALTLHLLTPAEAKR